MPDPARTGSSFVKSTRARSKIRGWFTKERREEAVEQGKEAIARAMRRQNLPLQRLMSQDSFAEVARSFATKTSPPCTRRSARATCRPSRSSRRCSRRSSSGRRHEDRPIDLPHVGRGTAAAETSDSGVLVRGAPDILVKLAKCCTPVPGDRDRRLRDPGERRIGAPRRLHTTSKSLRAEPERMIEVEWAPTTKSVFLVQIQVEALDRSGLL